MHSFDHFPHFQQKKNLPQTPFMFYLCTFESSMLNSIQLYRGFSVNIELLPHRVLGLGGGNRNEPLWAIN